jgi:hypothetical protein
LSAMYDSMRRFSKTVPVQSSVCELHGVWKEAAYRSCARLRAPRALRRILCAFN